MDNAKKINIIKRYLFAFSFLFMLTACGEHVPDEIADYEDSSTQVLNILALDIFEPVIRTAENNMNRAFERAEHGRTMQVNLTSYEATDDIEELHNRLRIQLMAGKGYDIVFWDRHNHRSMARNGFLHDIFTLIENNPHTSRTLFFENVISAYEYNNGLYLFPFTFGFEYFGINASLPQSIIDRFIQNDFITVYELLSLYRDLKRYYFDDFWHLYMFNASSQSISAPALFNKAAHTFIDFDNRSSHLNSPSFINFLDVFAEVFDTDDLRLVAVTGSNSPTRLRVENASRSHVFMQMSNALNPAIAYFTPLDDPLFLHFVPLANTDGNAKISPFHWWGGGATLGAVFFPLSGDGDLAWAYTLFLQNAILMHDAPTRIFRHVQPRPFFGSNSLVAPISLDDFPPHVGRVLNRVAEMRNTNMIRSEGIHRGNREEAVKNALAQFQKQSERPVTLVEHMLVSNIINDYLLEQFLLGIITSGELAQRVHNSVSLWLIE